MASAVPAEFTCAAYHRPIHGGHDPTPVKQLSQKAQHTVTQVPESPSISQRTVPDRISHKDSESIVQDSLNYHPTAPARPSTSLFDFLEESVPLENNQLVPGSHKEQEVVFASVQSPADHCPAARSPAAQTPVIAGAPSLVRSPPESHTFEEDSIPLPPSEQLHSQDKAAPAYLGLDQLPTASQQPTVAAIQTQAHSSAYAEPDDDDDEEEIQECISVRSQPVVPPAKPNSPAGVPSISPGANPIYSATRPNHSAPSDLNVPTYSSSDTSNMPPKASSVKAAKPASQARKPATTTSKKSFKSAPPVPELVNQGETSAVAILRQRKAGEISQTNTTKQASQAVSQPVSRGGTSQKTSVRSSQAATNKPATKLVPKLPTKQTSRKIEAPGARDEFGLSPDPDAADQGADVQRPVTQKSKTAKADRTTAVSIPPSKGGKSKSNKQAAKVADSDEDDDDEDYSAPRTTKSRAGATTRVSTRAQTQKANKPGEINVSTQRTTANDTMRVEKRTSRKSVSPDREELEEFENSVTHINSDGATGPRLVTRAPPAEPPAGGEAKARRRTQRETELFEAISSPDRATVPTAAKPHNIPEGSATQTLSTQPYNPPSEQGTTKRNPVTINDDSSTGDGEDAMNEDYDASFDQIIPEVTSQKVQVEQKTTLVEDQNLQSQSTDAHEPPVQQYPARLSEFYSDIDPLAQERAQRKPNLVSFDQDGPRNQGSRHKRKPSDPNIHDPPFEGAPSLGLDLSKLQRPPATAMSDARSHARKAPHFDPAESSTHIDAVAPLPYNLPENLTESKPKPATGHPRKSVSVEIPLATKNKESKRLESSSKAATYDDRHTSARTTRDMAKDKSVAINHAAFETRAPHVLSESLVKILAQQASKKLEASYGKLSRDAVMTNSLAPLGMLKASLMSADPRVPAPISSNRPGPENHTQALPTPSDSQAPSHVVQQRYIERPPRTTGGEIAIPPAQEHQESVTKLHSKSDESKAPGNDRKRSSTEMTGGPAKRQRSSGHKSLAHPTRSPRVRNPVSRRLSQIAENGSPIPYGIEIPQDTADSSSAGDQRMSTASSPSPFSARHLIENPFAQVTKLKHKETAVGSESPSKEVEALQQESPLQMSQAITHAGFEEDTQVTPTYAQASKPQKVLLKSTVLAPPEGPSQRAQPPQRKLGLMERLRSEVVPPTSGQEGKRDDAKDAEGDEAMEEEDADKTLVNEELDDGDDGDGNDSDSQNSSDSEDNKKPKSGVSMWRRALESHQGEVYDQLVHIAHRLTEHLKDHETAIQDISTDYEQDGARLIERLEKDNETRLEQYCIKRSKVQGALVREYEQLGAGVAKAQEDIQASHDRHVKISQRQVDAEGRLEQILQSFHH